MGLDLGLDERIVEFPAPRITHLSQKVEMLGIHPFRRPPQSRSAQGCSHLSAGHTVIFDEMAGEAPDPIVA